MFQGQRSGLPPGNFPVRTRECAYMFQNGAFIISERRFIAYTHKFAKTGTMRILSPQSRLQF